MPKNYSTRELRDILEATNKKFSKLIQTNTEISEKYIPIAKAYQNLIRLIEKNKLANTIITLYKLEAQLGLIQSTLNSISLSPANKNEFHAKEKKLEELKNRLNTLTNATIELRKKLPKNKAGLEKDYDVFLSQLNAYKSSWNTCYYNVKSAYYYNYAITLVEQVTEKIIKPSDTIRTLEKAIFLFEQSAYFYEKNGKLPEKNETLVEMEKTKSILISFKKEIIVSNLKINPELISNEKKMLCVKPTAIASVSSSVVSLTNEKTIKTAETLPLKKRKYIEETITASNTKKLVQTSQIDKDIIAVPIQIVKPIYKKVESENFKDEAFEEIELILTNNVPIDFIIYLQLIFEFAKFIKLNNKDTKIIFQHNLLTKIYLLDTLLHLINLLYSEDKKNIFIDLRHQALDMLNNLNTHYPTKQGWKLFHLEELKKNVLNKNKLCHLLLMEIKNYIWGVENLSKDPKLSSDLLHNISALISNFISIDTIEYIIEDTVNSSSGYLKNIQKEKQVFFYSRLSREIVKFYLATENKDWVKLNKIPLYTPCFLEELITWLSLAKKLALILNDYSFIEKISFLKKYIEQKTPNQTTKQTTQSFFNLKSLEINKEKLSTESAKTLFNKQFKLHIQSFYYVYGIPLTELNNIYGPLIQFTKKQVELFNSETQSTNNYNFLAKI